MMSSLRDPPATMGSESWKNQSLKILTLAQKVAESSARNCDIGRSVDTEPQIRDTLVTLSNDEIRRYMREVRVVVAKVRESLIETNEEIKALTRGKEALERTLEHTRKDIQLNKDSKLLRQARPSTEKTRDGADDLLDAEFAHLLNCKKSLEMQLRSVQQHLQHLDCIRKRTYTCLQERSRVLDLICHSLSAVLRPEKDILSIRPNRTQVEGRSSMVDPGRLGFVRPDSVSPYTVEVNSLLGDATEARNESAFLRRDLRCIIDQVDQLKQTAHRLTNEGLIQKMAETITLKQHLNLSMGDNRHALHRAQRWYDVTERAHGYTLGPVNYSDLTTREHLDRPVVRVFQRHPGTQMPEAQELIKATQNLVQSMKSTSRNIGLLKIARRKLKDDKHSKIAAAHVDSSVIHLRRSRADHRWCLGVAF